MFQSITRPHDLREMYDAAAASWHDRITALGYCDAYCAAITAFLPVTSRPQRVMDAGCGAGSFARAFVQHRGRVAVLTLADPAPHMLHEAQSRLAGDADEIILLAQAVEGLPAFPCQDLILCAHVLDHCTDPVRALRALGLALSRYGRLILIVTKPHWCNWLMWPVWRHKSYRPARIYEAVVAAGLTCTRDMGFASGPPRRTSHAYLVTHTESEILYADCHR